MILEGKIWKIREGPFAGVLEELSGGIQEGIHIKKNSEGIPERIPKTSPV